MTTTDTIMVLVLVAFFVVAVQSPGWRGWEE
jgi:hypothetical protein